MATRFWVSIPGRPEPIELTLEELAEKRKRGELPAGTLAHPVGTKAEWVALDSLAELREAQLFDAPPPSSSSAGVEIVASRRIDVPSLTISETKTESAAQDAPKDVEIASSNKPKRKIRWVVPLIILSAATVLVVGTIWVTRWLRSSYVRGTVLEHIPSDCDELTFTDFHGIDTHKAVEPIVAGREKALLDWSEDFDDREGFRRSKDDDDNRGRVSALRALESASVKAFGEVREFASCRLDEGTVVHNIVVVGGVFRGKNLLKGLRDALSKRSRKSREEDMELTESDGRPMLKIDEGRVVLLVNDHLAIMGRKSLVTKLIAPKSVGKVYGIKDADLFVHRIAGSGSQPSAVDERIYRSGDKLVYSRTSTPIGTVDVEVTAQRKRLETEVKSMRRNEALDAWSDAVEASDIVADGADVRITLDLSRKTIASTAKTLVDADARELARTVENLRKTPGSDLLRWILTPSVDVFDLKISPW